MGIFGSLFGENTNQKTMEILNDKFWIEGNAEDIELMRKLCRTNNPWEIACHIVSGRDLEGLSDNQRLKKGMKWLKAFEMMENQNLASGEHINFLKETIAFELDLDLDMKVAEMIDEINQRIVNG